MSSKPDYTRINCTVKLFAMYAAEKTREDKDFMFTAAQIGGVFGCTQQAAMRLISKCVQGGTFIRVDRKDKIKPYFFKITPNGIDYAEYLEDEMNKELSEIILNG